MKKKEGKREGELAPLISILLRTGIGEEGKKNLEESRPKREKGGRKGREPLRNVMVLPPFSIFLLRHEESRRKRGRRRVERKKGKKRGGE